MGKHLPQVLVSSATGNDMVWILRYGDLQLNCQDKCQGNASIKCQWNADICIFCDALLLSFCAANYTGALFKCPSNLIKVFKTFWHGLHSLRSTYLPRKFLLHVWQPARSFGSSSPGFQWYHCWIFVRKDITKTPRKNHPRSQNTESFNIVCCIVMNMKII